MIHTDGKRTIANAESTGERRKPAKSLTAYEQARKLLKLASEC